MSRSVAPLNVSPAIKTARWTFLILGIFYGANRLNSLRAYEEKAGPKRKEEARIRHEKFKAEEKIITTAEVIGVAKEFEVTEFPPGWENNL